MAEEKQQQTGTSENTSFTSPRGAYEHYLAHLDSTDITHVSKAAEKFAALFQGQPQPLADSGYVLFEKFYQRVDNIINDLHYKDTTDYSSLVLLPNEPAPKNLSKKLEGYRKLLAANGFNVAMTEGYTYLQQDRDFIAKHFYPFLSPTLQEYLVQLNKENKEGFQEDAGLTIGPTQLADRVIWWENFIKKHPDFILLKAAKAEKKSYLTTLFEGMDNSPVLNYDNNKLDVYFAEAYLHLQKKDPTSEANRLIKPFHTALQKGDTATAYNLITQYKLDGAIGY